MTTAAAPAPTRTRYRFHLPLRTEADLELYLDAAFGVRIPKVKVCPNHVAPWRAFADAYFALDSVTVPTAPRPASMAVWKGSRGLAGKTFTLGTLTVTEATTLKANVNILGGSGEQSKRVHEHEYRLWAHPSAPRHLLGGDPAGLVTRFTYGNQVKALMASQASVRGPHPHRLRLDEVDEMDLDIFDSAMGQTMAGTDPHTGEITVPAHTVMSSTHQYADGTMTEVLKRAEARGWPVYEWCYRETQAPHGWLHPAEIVRKRDEMTQSMWDIEVELGEPSPEGRAIVSAAVDKMFDAALGEHRGDEGEELIFEKPPSPEYYCSACALRWALEQEDEAGKHQDIARGHRILGPHSVAKFATGADWAKDRDWTIIDTWRVDVRPMRRVAWLRLGRRPWPEMIGRLDARLAVYPGPAKHDATGLGNVIHDYLQNGAEGLVMVGRARRDLFTDYIGAIERGEITGPRIKFAYGEHRYVTINDIYTGAGHPPDSFVAGALAHRAAGRADFGLTV